MFRDTSMYLRSLSRRLTLQDYPTLARVFKRLRQQNGRGGTEKNHAVSGLWQSRMKIALGGGNGIQGGKVSLRAMD